MIISSIDIFKFASEEEIIRLDKLYKAVFNQEVESKTLRWRFIENPLIHEFYFNFIAINNKGDIVGHTAFIPMHYIYNNHLMKGALSVGSAVERGYSGIFPKLYTELESRLISDHFDFLFAFPNEISFPFFVRYFEYKEHFFKFLQLNVNELSAISGSVLCEKYFHSIYNQLGENYLKWRIDNCPLNKYEILENSNFTIVYKRYKKDEIDLMYLKLKEPYFDLSPFVNTLSGINNVNKINIYSTNNIFSELLINLGFKEIKTRNKCVYKILNHSIDIDSLFLQMIDSDIF